MKKIVIELSDEAYLALTAITNDPKDWLLNAANARANAAAYEHLTDPKWSAAIVAYSKAGGDVTDPVAVLAHALGAGTILNAEKRQEADEAKRNAQSEEMKDA